MANHEKGSVENAVGFLRRNLLVPVPEAASVDELNEGLRAGCERICCCSLRSDANGHRKLSAVVGKN